jgi:hypothetical protein
LKKISLLLDEDVHLVLGSTLRKRGFDVIHTQDLDRKGKADSEQLAFAVNNEKCIFSYNVRDFVTIQLMKILNQTLRLRPDKKRRDCAQGDAFVMLSATMKGEDTGSGVKSKHIRRIH